jgi:hypothetical protein
MVSMTFSIFFCLEARRAHLMHYIRWLNGVWHSVTLALLTNRILAFILYRQHSQAAVVAQNPGLANPDISKIIGERWRTLPEEKKEEWKALAEVNTSFSAPAALYSTHLSKSPYN